MATKLSKYFTLEELTQSNTAEAYHIKNVPTPADLENLKKLANEVLDPIREKYGHPIMINSGFRCPQLNARVGGSKTSQHQNGGAADIRCTATTKAELFKMIKSMIDSGELKVGQLIWEFGTRKEPRWIHVSIPYRKVNDIKYIFK